MRKELIVTQEAELSAINLLAEKLIKEGGYNASNCVIVTVSTDYSSIAGQIIRHALTWEGEIAYGFGIDVPYPDQEWDKDFIKQACSMMFLHSELIGDKDIVLIEAGVIRGTNYFNLIDLIERLGFTNYIATTALYENAQSSFKCNYVVNTYDNTTQDLTFWWEKENNHWK